MSVILNVAVDELVEELQQRSTLPEREILYAVAQAAAETAKNPKHRNLVGQTAIEALDKIKRVEVKDGEPIPYYKLEILKDLIRKAALRKLKKLEQQRSEKENTDDGRRQEKETC